MTFLYMKLFNFDLVCMFSYNLLVTTECKLIRGWSCFRLEGNLVVIVVVVAAAAAAVLVVVITYLSKT